MKKIIFAFSLIPILAFADKPTTSFVNLAQTFLGIQNQNPNVGIIPIANYVGLNSQGERCQVQSEYTAYNSISVRDYANIDFSILVEKNHNDDKEWAGVSISGQDEVTIENKSPTLSVITSTDSLHEKRSTIVAQFNNSQNQTAYNLQSLQLVVESNNGIESQDCADLQPQEILTNSLLEASIKLAKSYSGIDKQERKRMTQERVVGCYINMDSQLFCSWDVSEDLNSSSGIVLEVYLEVKNNKAIKVIKTAHTTY